MTGRFITIDEYVRSVSQEEASKLHPDTTDVIKYQDGRIIQLIKDGQCLLDGQLYPSIRDAEKKL